MDARVDTGTGGTAGDTGTGGDAGRGATGGTRPPNPEPLSGGCGCKVADSDATAGARSGAALLLGLVGLFGRRRRRQQQSG